MSKVAELARGRWNSILPHFGIDHRYLKNKHGPCIKCGGKERARFDNKGGNGTFYCNRCECYDGFTALQAFTGKPFSEIAREVEKFVGAVPIEEPKAGPSLQQQIQWMRQAWVGAQPIGWPDPVDQWLNNRLGGCILDSAGSESLRYHPGLPYYEDGKQAGVYPAMLARVVGPDGSNKQLHRTFLTPGGQKALGKQSRALMPGPFPPGSYVPLCDHTDEVLGIAEGIETALAAAKGFKVPVHAALTAGNLQAWTPPATVQRVIVFGDADESMTGQAAAYALAKRLVNEREKGKLSGTIDVRIPEKLGYDWNKVFNPDV